jgi:hypothetical protein
MAGANARQWKAVSLITLRAISTSTQGAAIDMAAYANLAKREMKVVWFVKGAAGTTISITPAVTECDTTNGTFAAPAQYTAITAVTTDSLTEQNFRADKRYIRAEVTLTANTTATDIHAVAFVIQREANS